MNLLLNLISIFTTSLSSLSNLRVLSKSFSDHQLFVKVHRIHCYVLIVTLICKLTEHGYEKMYRKECEAIEQ